jgi:hypothetical protein
MDTSSRAFTGLGFKLSTFYLTLKQRTRVYIPILDSPVRLHGVMLKQAQGNLLGNTRVPRKPTDEVEFTASPKIKAERKTSVVTENLKLVV